MESKEKSNLGDQPCGEKQTDSNVPDDSKDRPSDTSQSPETEKAEKENTRTSNGDGKPNNKEDKKDVVEDSKEPVIHNLFDKIFKLSTQSSLVLIIALINYLFNTTHSSTSEVTLLPTVTVSTALKETLSDLIVRITEVIDGVKKIFEYLIEFQSYYAYDMAPRMSSYAAQREFRVRFTEKPEHYAGVKAVELYLWDDLDRHQRYDISFFQFLSTSFLANSYEDNLKNMPILLPLEMFRYYKLMKSDPSEENADKLVNHMNVLLKDLKKMENDGVLDNFTYSTLRTATLHAYKEGYNNRAPFQKGGKYDMSLVELNNTLNDDFSLLERWQSDKMDWDAKEQEWNAEKQEWRTKEQEWNAERQLLLAQIASFKQQNQQQAQ